MKKPSSKSFLSCLLLCGFLLAGWLVFGPIEAEADVWIEAMDETADRNRSSAASMVGPYALSTSNAMGEISQDVAPTIHGERFSPEDDVWEDFAVVWDGVTRSD